MSEIVDLLRLTLELDFMRLAFVITLVIAVPMALISCLLVLKGWSLMGDAVSHAVLPGVVLAYVVGLPLSVGAFVAGLFAAVASGYLSDNSRVKDDTVLGIVFSGMFAFGLVLYVQVESDVHLDHILFGDMLGIAPSDLVETGLIALVATVFLLVFRKDLLVQAFDPQHARAIGLRTGFLHYGLLAVLSLLVVGALKAVGIILAIAFLVAPGAIATLLTRRYHMMQAAAIAIAVVSTLTGIFASFVIDSAPAPTVVLVMTAIFVISFTAGELRRALARA